MHAFWGKPYYYPEKIKVLGLHRNAMMVPKLPLSPDESCRNPHMCLTLSLQEDTKVRKILIIVIRICFVPYPTQCPNKGKENQTIQCSSPTTVNLCRLANVPPTTSHLFAPTSI